MRAAVFDAEGRALRVGQRVQTLSKKTGGQGSYIQRGRVTGTVLSFGDGFVRVKSGPTSVATRHPCRVVILG